jgi:two-component system sensor histidine kinase TorS
MEEWTAPGYLAELLEEDPAAAEDILQIFIADSTKQISELGQSLSSEGLAGPARILHSLKGSSALIGAFGMAELCAQAETRISTGESAFLPDAFEELKRYHKALITSMDCYLKGLVRILLSPQVHLD